MDNENYNIIIYSIICLLSITSDITVLFLLKNDKSSYTSLLKVISLFELSFIYSKFNYIMNLKENSGYEDIYNKKIDIFNKITFDKFKRNANNVNIPFEYIDEAFYFSMRNSYIFLNTLFCIETINLIQRPFTQAKNKIPLYFLMSFIIVIITFVLFFLFHDKIEDIYIISSLYLLFILSGVCSIIFLIIKFCLNKPLIQRSKNIFIFRHFIYILIFSLFFISEIDYFFEDKKIKNIIILSIGIIMSLIKIFDKICCCFHDKSKSKDKGVTSTISSNLNTEFMCCVLYGLTDIFKKYNISNIINHRIEKTIHTIKYLNYLTGKKSSGISNIQMKISESKTDNSSDSSSSKLEESFNNDEEDALIIEYSNNIFSELRKKDGISNNVIIKSFSPIKNKNAIAKMSESKGRSGSFFFYSHDRKFIIKTITSSELKTFLKIINDYYSYINNNQNSAITKIYGLYSIVINVSSINIILMQNLFFCSPVHIQKMFDLKGSAIQRITKNVQNWKRDQVLKDLDYQWVTKVERKLVDFNRNDINEILNNLKNDINFFKRMHLMDYSLLFIIIEYPTAMDPDYNQIISLLDDPKYIGHVYKSANMEQIYIVGIIDYLQKYDIKKKMENLFKGIIYGKERNMISAVEPEYYAKRFYDFMEKYVFVEGEPILN